MPSTLLSLFSKLTDLRRDEGKMYPLAPMLLYILLAMLAGAVSYRQVHAFIPIHPRRLNATFGAPLRKLPAYTTLRFILHGLNAAELERVLRQHSGGLAVSGTHAPDARDWVAIDGKPLRGSFDAFKNPKKRRMS